MAGREDFKDQAYLIWRKFISGDFTGAKIMSALGFNSGEQATISSKKFKRSDTGPLVHKISGRYHPSTVVSKMMRSERFDAYKGFLDLQTHKLTSLVPSYAFYKVNEDTGTKLPFYFQTAAEEITRSSILEVPSTRAVGVSSFGINFVGKDTATAKKMLTFDLEIYSDNIKNFFLDAPGGYARIAELFTIFRNKGSRKAGAGSTASKPAAQVKTAQSSEIAVEIGYSIPRQARELFTQEEIRAIENSKLELRLTYINHNINLSADGSATVSVEYSGRALSTLANSSFDLLASAEERIALSSIRALDSESDMKTKPNKTKKAKTKLQKQEEMIAQKAERREFFRNVIEKLETKGLLYDYDLKAEDMMAFVTTQENQENKKEDTAKEKKSEATKSTAESVEEKSGLEEDVIKKVSFIYLGDLMMQVSENMIDSLLHAKKQASKKSDDSTKKIIKQLDKEIKSLKNTKILTSNMYVKVDTQSEESIFKINIADIPISLPLFQKYYFESVEQKPDYSITLYAFLKDCVTKLAPDSFDGHVFGGAYTLQTKSFNIRSMELAGAKLKDSKDTIDIKDVSKSIEFSESNSKTEKCDYFIIYADHGADISISRPGSRLQDIKDGIYHFYLGRDRGVLKEVNFSKMDIKYRKEALIVKSVSLYDQLKMPYNASITMFGNSFFYPGSLFFIDPSSVGMGDPREYNSAAFQIGLGGYYQATSVSTKFDGQSMETTVQGTQVSWAEDQTDLIRQLTDFTALSRSPGS